MKKIVKLVVVFIVSAFMFTDVNADELDPFSVNGIGYSTFDSALAAVQNNGEIVLESDYETSDTIKINTDKTISFNMNGHSITSSNVYGVITVLKGNVNIYDNVGGSTFISTAFDSAYAKAVYVYRKYSSSPSVLTLNNISIESNYYGIYLGKYGKATLNNVNINSVYNATMGNNADLTINSGIYYARDYNLFGYDANTVTDSSVIVNGGSFYANMNTFRFSSALSEKIPKFIAGGTYNFNVEDNILDGYKVLVRDSNYVVVDENYDENLADNVDDTNTNDNSLDDIDLDALINEYEEKLNGLDDRDNALNDRENELNNRENELDNRENTLDNKENNLNDLENDLNNREDTLDNRENSLDDRENSLDNRENDLNDLENDLNNKEDSLDNRENALDDRENSLDDRENDLNDRDNSLDDRENSLDNREEELYNKENTLNELEDELNNREQELIERERQLNVQPNTNSPSPVNYIIINHYIDNSSNNNTNNDDTDSRNVSLRVDYNYLDNVEDNSFDEIKDEYNIDYLINVDCFLYDNDTSSVINKLTQLNKKIHVKIQLPEDYNPGSYIYVAKYHNNKVELIKATVTEDNMLTFETSQFSLFAIVSPKTAESMTLDFVPSAADSVGRINRISNINNVWLLIISLILIPVYVVMRKKAK